MGVYVGENGHYTTQNSFFLSRLLAPVSRICIKTGKRTIEFFLEFPTLLFCIQGNTRKGKIQNDI